MPIRDLKNKWLEFEHPIYTQNKQRWQKYQDCFEGGDVVKEHLIMHPREDNDVFEFRKKSASYINLIAPPLNQILDGVFEQTITRDFSKAPFLETVDEDVDRRGTRTQAFFRETAIMALLKGSASVLIDRTNALANQVALSDVPLRDRYPYMYRVDPLQIIDWRYDQNTGNLISIKIIVSGTAKTDITAQYSSSDMYLIYTKDSIAKYDFLSGELIGEVMENPLGYIPLVTIYAERKDVLYGLSMVRDIVMLALSVYNKLSHAEEYLEFHALAEVWLQGANKDFVDSYIRSNSKIKTYPKDVNAPMILQAGMDTYHALMDYVTRQVATIYNLYKLRIVNRDKEVAESGISKEFDLIPTNQQLASIAHNMETLENQVYAIMMNWEMGKSISETKAIIISKYPTRFDSETLLEEIENLLKAETLRVFPDQADAEATKLVLDKYFSGRVDSAVIKELKDACDETLAAKVLKEVAALQGFMNQEEEPKTALKTTKEEAI